MLSAFSFYSASIFGGAIATPEHHSTRAGLQHAGNRNLDVFPQIRATFFNPQSSFRPSR